MKVQVCDACLAENKKLTPATTKYMRCFDWGNVTIYLCKRHEIELNRFSKNNEPKEVSALLKIQEDANKSYHKMFN